jgi:hypothetical protein
LHSHPNYNARLARLFEFGMGEPIGWNDDELADVLRHQLKSSLLADLKPLASQMEALGLTIISADAPQLDKFEDLFNHPNPNLALLRLAKDFAKTADSHLEDPLPSAVATALYLLIIAVAMIRHSEKITVMSDAELRGGFEWTESQEWIDESLRNIAKTALALLDSPNGQATDFG